MCWEAARSLVCVRGSCWNKPYAIRLWLDRNKMAALGLTPVDIRDALERESVELPSGRIDGRQVEVSVRAASRFTTPGQFNDLVLRESGSGVVRLKDVGEAVVGPANLRNLMERNGAPALGVVLRPQPGANQIAIADELYRRLDLIQEDLPADVEATVGFAVALSGLLTAGRGRATRTGAYTRFRRWRSPRPVAPSRRKKVAILGG